MQKPEEINITDEELKEMMKRLDEWKKEAITSLVEELKSQEDAHSKELTKKE